MKRIVLAASLGAVFMFAYLKYYQGERPSDNDNDNDYLWLEEVMGSQALRWVRERNTATLEELTRDPRFQKIQQQSLEILNAKDKLVTGSIRGDFVYNLWRDADHVKGLWRRTHWTSYVQNLEEWEVLLDLDKLAEQERKSWVFKGARCLEPEYQRCILSLSDGGKDASYKREFDINSKSFVDDGFSLPESKSGLTWLDKDTVFVTSTLGQNEMTDSGYARVIRKWIRGTSFESSQVIFEGQKSDVSVSADVYISDGTTKVFFTRGTTFYTSKVFAFQDGQITPLQIPDDARFISFLRDQVVLSLRSAQLGFQAGDLVSIPYKDLIQGQFNAVGLFSPSESQAFLGALSSAKHIFISYLDNVQTKLMRLTPKLKDNRIAWEEKSFSLPGNGRIGLVSIARDTPKMIISYEDFLTPRQLLSLNPETLETAKIQTSPSRFDHRDLVAQQMIATSKDGTKVPYFIIHNNKINFDGNNPTLLYGYGGFELSMLPRYSSVVGKNWLEQGGVYVVANIRGGGEFGPKWHQAAIKKNRHKAFEDFISVGEDLIRLQVTSPEKLAISGGSNGGLLVGAVATQRPDLFKAVICAVPLLDMMRFHKLLAGASWVGEYGSAEDPKMADYLMSYSPFHAVKAKKDYPEIFFITSTKDDRVHPGHARKMARRMELSGYKTYYFENIEGGHSASADLKQRADQLAMRYTYLFQKLNM